MTSRAARDVADARLRASEEDRVEAVIGRGDRDRQADRERRGALAYQARQARRCARVVPNLTNTTDGATHVNV